MSEVPSARLPVPHGGLLVNRIAPAPEVPALRAHLATLPALRLNERQLSDLEMIAIGGFSPLDGFLTRDDYTSVVETMRLANGLPWTMPVTLDCERGLARAVRDGDDVALLDANGEAVALLNVREPFERDPQHEAQVIYGTTDAQHPGVAALLSQGDVLLGGPVTLLERRKSRRFAAYRLDPLETRAYFAAKGWRSVVGFQTRNPVHRAHEYIQKCALELVDGLLLHPIVGETKGDDIPADVRMRCYEALLAHYYPPERTLLAVNPAAMRYAGPREAILHALVRKNYGCSHFIVGRDHAGVGNYYGPYDAQHIFSEFGADELGITPLFFENTFYCRRCDAMSSRKTCPHLESEHVILSGTRVRELLAAGQAPPLEFSRPEVARVLIEHAALAAP